MAIRLENRDGQFKKPPLATHQKVRQGLELLIDKQRRLTGDLAALQADLAQIPHAQDPKAAENVVKTMRKLDAATKGLESIKESIFGA